jgi:hypothetical protein
MVRGSGTNDHSLARVLTHAGDTLKARLTLAWALDLPGRKVACQFFCCSPTAIFA